MAEKITTVLDQTEITIDFNGTQSGLATAYQIIKIKLGESELNNKETLGAWGRFQMLLEIVQSSRDAAERYAANLDAARILSWIGAIKKIKINVVEKLKPEECPEVESMEDIINKLLAADFTVDQLDQDLNSVGTKFVAKRTGCADVKIQRINTWRVCGNVDLNGLNSSEDDVREALKAVCT